MERCRKQVGAIVHRPQWPEECAEYRRELPQYVRTIVDHYTRMKRLRFIAKNDQTGDFLCKFISDVAKPVKPEVEAARSDQGRKVKGDSKPADAVHHPPRGCTTRYPTVERGDGAIAKLSSAKSHGYERELD